MTTNPPVDIHLLFETHGGMIDELRIVCTQFIGDRSTGDHDSDIGFEGR